MEPITYKRIYGDRIHVRAQHEEGHSLEMVWPIASREPFDTFRIATTFHLLPKAYAIYNTVFPGFQTSLSAQRRLGNRWVGPINTVLKLLKLATVTPGATSTLSASSASLFLCRFLDAFPSSLTYAAINLQPPWHAALYQTRGQCGGAPVPRDAKHPTILCHPTHPLFLLLPRPMFSRVFQLSRHNPLG